MSKPLPTRKRSTSLLVALVVAPILSMFLGGEPIIAQNSMAQNSSPEYTFLMASRFVCDSGNCPAAAKSVNRDTYEITGAGTFNPQSKSSGTPKSTFDICG